MRIGDICTYAPKSQIKAGEAVDGAEYMFFTSSAEENKRYSDYQIDGEGIIMGTGGNATLHYYSGKFSTSTDCVVLMPDDHVRCKYLYYFFKANMHVLEAGFKGAGLRHTNKAYISDIRIDTIPAFEEQDRLVLLLDKLQQVISYRETELTKLDELVKARFVELFGDLNINNMGWDEKPLLDVCNQLKRYPTFCNMEYIEHGTRVIRIGNILLDGHMDIDEANYVFVYDTVNDDFPDTVIEKYDIVMAVRGDGSAAKRIGIIQEDRLIGANISPNLIRIQANPNIVDPIFLFYYLTGEVGQNRLDTYVNKTAKKNIAAKDIAKVITPIPDMELQKEYVGFVKQVDKSKVTIQESLDKTQILFNSLMQKYFG